MKIIFIGCLIFGCLTLFGTTVTAQEEINRPSIRDIVRPKPKSAVAPKPRSQSKSKPQRVNAQLTITARKESPPPRRTTTVAPLALKLSTLVVVTKTAAEVTLQSSVKGATPMIHRASETGTAEIGTSETGTAQFDNISPGNYTVTATLDGYSSLYTDVDVVAQKTVTVNLDLKQITYQVIIETNVSDGGEVRYAPYTAAGTNPDGTVKLGEVSGSCIVPIKNGQALIKELKKGTYNLKIQGGVEYKDRIAKLILPDDIPDDLKDENGDLASDKPIRYPIDLERQQSTSTFGTAWSSSDWVFPAGWKMNDNGLKTADLPGIALPSNQLYRYYLDFEMISNVRLLDDGTAGFVVRALDDQNYYLIQISGAKAAEPFQMQGFVVKKGKREPLNSSSIQTFASSLAANFNIIIKGEKNVFTILIVDREKGEYVTLGKITDPRNNFNKGAVGIAGQQNSNFQVFNFKVCTPLCSEAEK
ncbi:MAG: carboxypeptidase-like regulatory domain-containing protein [Pyrinomonadaceae bacterium]|nr:carboxypeptidase-like regulatory domain-containing protein [Pyrinomonadaceae bacterium]